MLFSENFRKLRGEAVYYNKHINLLADFMTSRGKLTLIIMSHMKERGCSYSTRASNKRMIFDVLDSRQGSLT
jgi:DNA-directed RNA polymerase II subunit RPB1